MNFFSVFTSVFTLVILIVPGYLLARFRMIPESLAKGLSTLLLYVCQPMLTFMSFQKTAYSSEIAVNMLIVAGVALAAHLVMIAVVFLIFRRKTDARYRVVQFSAVFGNCGFMGLPFLQALFPDAPETLIYGAVIVAVFNFLNWTVGVALLTGEKKHMKITRALFNPTSVALFISLPLFLLLKRPLAELFEAGTYAQAFTDKLLFSFDLLGNTVTPLAMIVLGIRLSEMKLKEIFASAASGVPHASAAVAGAAGRRRAVFRPLHADGNERRPVFGAVRGRFSSRLRHGPADDDSFRADNPVALSSVSADLKEEMCINIMGIQKSVDHKN